MQEQVHPSRLSYDFLGVDFPLPYTSFAQIFGIFSELSIACIKVSAEGLNDAVHEYSCDVSISLYDRLRCQMIKK